MACESSFAAHSGLHDITDANCWAQNSSPHGCVFKTFSKQPKKERKNAVFLFLFFSVSFSLPPPPPPIVCFGSLVKIEVAIPGHKGSKVPSPFNEDGMHFNLCTFGKR